MRPLNPGRITGRTSLIALMKESNVNCGIAYVTWINTIILTIMHCFWFWYLATTKERLHACKEKERMRDRCIELGHDPSDHGL